MQHATHRARARPTKKSASCGVAGGRATEAARTQPLAARRRRGRRRYGAVSALLTAATAVGEHTNNDGDLMQHTALFLAHKRRGAGRTVTTHTPRASRALAHARARDHQEEARLALTQRGRRRAPPAAAHCSCSSRAVCRRGDGRRTRRRTSTSMPLISAELAARLCLSESCHYPSRRLLTLRR